MATLIGKAAEIQYKFSDDKTGSLTEPKLEIFVQFREKNDFSHGIELSSNHKHHLPTMFIHVDENKGEKPNISVHPKPERTLKEYLDSLKRNEIEPVMLYNSFIKHDGGGGAAAGGRGGGGGAGGSGGGAAAAATAGGGGDAAPAAGYYYVPNEVRAIVKAIISALLYLHQKEGSLSGHLGWDNFVIYDAYLALRNASYSKKDKVTRKQDFEHVHDFIANNIFDDPRVPIPTDMENLLESLRSYPRDAKPERSKLMGYHFATMSHSERIYFMINCSDKGGIIDKKYCSDEERIKGSVGEQVKHYSRAIKCLVSQNGWPDKITNSKFPDIYNCYQKGKRKGIYNNDANEDNMKRNAIRCCRNLATHLGEHLEKHNRPFTEKDIDIMVSSIFAPMLVDFSWRLLRQRVLKYVITWMEDGRCVVRK